MLARSFVPGEWALVRDESRLETVHRRIRELPDDLVGPLLEEVRGRFAHRHRDLEGVMRRHYALVEPRLDDPPVDPDRRLLLGAYFTQEYALEAAALCNPSVVPAPGSGSGGTARDVILALRAIGEGHISSIELREGTVRQDGSMVVRAPSGYLATGSRESPRYHRRMFGLKLDEMGADTEIAGAVLEELPEDFSRDDLDRAVAAVRASGLSPAAAHETLRMVDWLASSNYVVTFPTDSRVDERVLFPEGPLESQGMEDARVVRFVDDDGSVTYYATYTAFDGFNILPQLIETDDFRRFRITTLNGAGAQNKGIALFPRRIRGRYAALSRHDRETISYMTSENIRFWGETTPLHIPTEPWELIQVGNCGSPIETEAGWLVLTHGVGPMRRYALGALLLDLDEPTRVLGHLSEPLLAPSPDQRDGYVPNVVYSCGGMVHGDHLILPYGFADYAVAVASVPLDALLAALVDDSG